MTNIQMARLAGKLLSETKAVPPPTGEGYEGLVGPCLLSPRTPANPYALVTVTGKFGRKLVGAHRITHERMYGPVPDGKVVRHRCDRAKCVNPIHTVIGTKADNNRDRKEREKYATQPKGEQHCRAKVTEHEVREIRAMCQMGVTQQAAADQYGLHIMSVSDIVRRKNWKHVT